MITMLLLQAAAATQAAPVVSPPAPIPPWTLVTRTNATTGMKGTSVSVTARDGGSRMVLRCDAGAEQVVSIQVIARQALNAPGKDGAFPDKAVQLRFDGGPALEFDWEAVANGVYDRDTVSVTALAAELAKAKSVKVSMTNAANFGFEASYDGPPSAGPVTQVLAACGYTLGVVPAAKAPAASK